MDKIACDGCRRSVTFEPGDEPDELNDWLVDQTGCWLCFDCRPKELPPISDRELARLAGCALFLAEEVRNAIDALRANNCPQTADDLKQKTDELMEYVAPLFGHGERMVFELTGWEPKRDEEAEVPEPSPMFFEECRRIVRGEGA